MPRQDSVAIVETFWREVWQQPQDPDAIDRLVHEDFVITSGGRDIVGREPFKAWVRDFLAKVHDFQFHIVETFQNHDGSRVASRWRVTGRNLGADELLAGKRLLRRREASVSSSSRPRSEGRRRAIGKASEIPSYLLLPPPDDSRQVGP